MTYRHLIAFKAQGLFIGILLLTVASCNVPTQSYDKAKVRAQEDALEAALRYTRQAIKEYIDDHGKPPGQLEDLVTSGYFASIPIDPMTNKPDWVIEFQECKPPTPCEKLIKNVHSSSKEKSSRNNPYSEW